MDSLVAKLIPALVLTLAACGGSDWPADAVLDPHPQLLVQQPYCPPDPSTFVGPLPAVCFVPVTL